MQFNDLGTQLSQMANEAKASGLSDQATAQVLLRYSQSADTQPSPAQQAQ